MPSVPWQRLNTCREDIQKKLRFQKLAAMTIGAKGLWTPRQKQKARKLLSSWAPKIRAISDLELAHSAAFSGGKGILIIAGTGCVALGKDEHNRTRRAGGLGPLLGDEGSAFWIGKEALRDPRLRRSLKLNEPLTYAHGKQPVREIAAIAVRVLRFARHNSQARALLNHAIGHLIRLVAELRRNLEFSGEIPIACYGGLFSNEDFRKSFHTALIKKRTPLRPQDHRLDAAAAAALLSP